MTPEELRAIIAYLRDRVYLKPEEINNPVTIAFDSSTEEEMIDAGLNAEGIKQILGASWWKEMVEDIVETPDFCEPEDSPQQVLEYAKDVVSDYIRKRYQMG